MFNLKSIAIELFSPKQKRFANILETIKLFKNSDEYNRQTTLENLCRIFRRVNFAELVSKSNTLSERAVLQSVIEIIPELISFCLKPEFGHKFYSLFYETIIVDSFGIKSLLEIQHSLTDFVCQKALGDFFSYELRNAETYFNLNSGKMFEAINRAINSYHYALRIAETEEQQQEIYQTLNRLEKDIWEFINILQRSDAVEDLQKLWENAQQFIHKFNSKEILSLREQYAELNYKITDKETTLKKIPENQDLPKKSDFEKLQRQINDLRKDRDNLLNALCLKKLEEHFRLFELSYPADKFYQTAIHSPSSIKEAILAKTQQSTLQKLEQLENQGFLVLAKFGCQAFIECCKKSNWPITQENMQCLLALQNRPCSQSSNSREPQWRKYYQRLKKIRKDAPRWLRKQAQIDQQHFSASNRNKFAKQVQQAEIKLNQDFIKLLHDITADIVKQLGEPPKACDFYLLSLGSLSFNCAAFFSDIESCLAVSMHYPQNKIYFTRFLLALEIMIRLLGEDEKSFRAGFHLDGEIRPQISNNLFARADKFIQPLADYPVPNGNELVEEDTLTDGIRFSLMTPNVIYAHQVTDRPLLKSYFDSRKEFNERKFNLKQKPLTVAGVDTKIATIKYHQACALTLLAMRDIKHVRKKIELRSILASVKWLPEYEAFDETTNHIDIKSHFIKFLRCFVLDLLWYHNLYLDWEKLVATKQNPIKYLQQQTVYTAIDLLAAQQILNQDFAEKLKEATALTTVIRNRQQWYCEGQAKPEIVLLTFGSETPGYLLSPIERQVLQTIETTLIHPLYEVLTHWIDKQQLLKKLNAMQNFHIAAAQLEVVIEKLAQRQETFENMAPAIIRGIEYLELCQVDIIEYLKMHCQLPTAEFRQFFRNLLKQKTRFAEQVKHWPNPNGEREIVLEQERRWHETLGIILSSVVKDQYPKEDLPCIEVKSLTYGDRILAPQIVRQLLADGKIYSNGHFKPKEEQPVKLSGRHLTISLSTKIDGHDINIHLKIFPESPCNEYAAGVLTRLLAGDMAPYVELTKFVIGDAIYPVLISKSVMSFGQIFNVKELLKNQNLVQEYLINNLAIEDYSRRLIASIATNNSDANPNNYVLVVAKDGQSKLVCIDNERAFSSTIIRDALSNRLVVHIKDLAFCLQHLKTHAFAEKARLEFMSINLESLIRNWLNKIFGYMNNIWQKDVFSWPEIKNLFKQDAESSLSKVKKNLKGQKLERHKCSILTTIAKTYPRELYNKLFCLQQVLKDRPQLRCAEILAHRKVMHVVGKYYRNKFEKHSEILGRIKQVFKDQYTDEFVSSTSISQSIFAQVNYGNPATFSEVREACRHLMWQTRRDLAKIIRDYQVRKNYATIIPLLEAGSQEGLNKLNEIGIRDYRAELINQLDFARINIPNKSQLIKYQTKILDALCFHEIEQRTLVLSFNNCLALDNAALERILTFYLGIKRLNLRGCSNLKYLARGTTRFIGYDALDLNDLKEVQISDCPNLKIIKLETPCLKKITSDTRLRFKNIEINSQNLIEAYFPNCYGVDGKLLETFLRKHPKLIGIIWNQSGLEDFLQRARKRQEQIPLLKARINNAKSIAVLLQVLPSEASEVKDIVEQALRQLGIDYNNLLEVLFDICPNPAQLMNIAIKILRNESCEIDNRRAAINILQQIILNKTDSGFEKFTEIIILLIKLLCDKEEPKIKSAAMETLKQLGAETKDGDLTIALFNLCKDNSKAINALIQILKDEAYAIGTRKTVVAALGKIIMINKKADQRIDSILRDETVDKYWRIEMAVILNKLELIGELDVLAVIQDLQFGEYAAGNKAIKAFQQLVMKNKSDNLMVALFQSYYNNPEVVTALLQLSNDKKCIERIKEAMAIDNKYWLIEAIVFLNQPKLIKAADILMIIRDLRNKNRNVSGAAEIILEQIVAINTNNNLVDILFNLCKSEPKITDALIQLLQNKVCSPRYRNTAAIVLSKINLTNKQIYSLNQFLNDETEDKYWRIEMAMILKRPGLIGEASILAIVQDLKKGFTRNLAEEALKQLGTGRKDGDFAEALFNLCKDEPKRIDALAQALIDQACEAEYRKTLAIVLATLEKKGNVDKQILAGTFFNCFLGHCKFKNWRQAFYNLQKAKQFFIDTENVLADLQIEELLNIIKESKLKNFPVTLTTAVFSILNFLGIKFNHMDLRGIKIGEADLGGGQFDHAQLQGADLRGANLAETWLRGAILDRARLHGVKFGELPYIKYEKSVCSIAYSKDCRLFAVAAGNEIYFYDANTYRFIRKVSSGGSARSISFDPSGKYLVLEWWNDDSFSLWDVKEGRELKRFIGHTHWVSSINFSPCGKYLASGSWDRTVRLWDVKSGNELKQFLGHTDNVCSVSFSPCGKYLASGGKNDIVRLWNVASGSECKRFVGHTGEIQSIRFSPPNGKYLASGSWNVGSGAYDNVVRLWDVASGKQLKQFTHSYYVNCIGFSPCGKYLASGGRDEVVCLWDVESGKKLKQFRHSNSVKSISFSPCGKYLASADDNTVRLWNVANYVRRKRFNGHNASDVDRIYFNSGGGYFASKSGDTIVLWDMISGKELNRFTGRIGYKFAFDPNGEYFASTSDSDKIIRLWDIASGKELKQFIGHTKGIITINFSPCGKYLASGSWGETIRLWNIESGRVFKQFIDRDYPLGIRFSPCGKYLASRYHYSIFINFWDIKSGKLLKRVRNTGLVGSISFAPNGKYLISGKFDHTISLWDVESGKERKQFIGHTSCVLCTSFAPNGKYFASGGWDKTVRLWDVESGKCVAILDEFLSSINKVSLQSNQHGEYLAVESYGCIVFLWQVVKNNEDYRFIFKWRNGPAWLNLKGVSIEGATGLSETNYRLLKQRGAVGTPAEIIPDDDYQSSKVEEVDDEAESNRTLTASPATLFKSASSHHDDTSSSHEFPNHNF